MKAATKREASDNDIWAKLLSCGDLPSPPGIAIELVNLAQSSETDFEQVEQIVKLDPVIAAKLLRLANSSFYARDRKIENLRQAIGQFGLNGTLIVALTFSLIKVPKGAPAGLDYNRYWLRSLSAAIICRRLSQLCSAGAQESFYLAGLLQDIGILAIDCVEPELYQELVEQCGSHQGQIEYEQSKLGLTHNDVGAWLLEKWQFPQLYVDATSSSHMLENSEPQSEIPLLSLCVSVSSYLADLWILPSTQIPAEVLCAVTEQLNLDDDAIDQLIADAQVEISEIAQLFDLTLFDETMAASLIFQAKDGITMRSLLTERLLAAKSTKVEQLEKHSSQLEHKLDFDELTGVHSRAYAYALLEELFPQSAPQGRPISLVFVDLDDFKQINDQYGHRAGDKVLKSAAETLTKATREGDIVARTGGEEFLVIMNDTGFVNASAICERLVARMSSQRVDIDAEQEVSITASAGLSVHGEEMQFTDVHCLIDSADVACYKAKSGGKNRWVYAAAA